MFVIFIMNLVHQERQSVVEASQLLEFLPSVKFNDGEDYQDDEHEDNPQRIIVIMMIRILPGLIFPRQHCVGQANPVTVCLCVCVILFANIVLILVKLSF